MNEPRAPEAGRIGIAGGARNINWTAGGSEGDSIAWAPSAAPSGFSYVPRRFAIIPDIDPTGVVDASTEINRCLNVRNGAWVHIPDGAYRLDAQVTFNKEGTTLTGAERGFSQPYKIFNNGYTNGGALFLIRHTGKAFRFEQPNCRWVNLEAYYPDQNHAPGTTNLNELTVYDYTFSIPDYAHGTTVANATVHNPYQFLKFEPNGGLLENIKAFPLWRGMTFPRCGAAPAINNVQFNPVGDYDQGGGILAWTKANGVAFMLDGIEGFQMVNSGAFGYAFGFYIFDEDNDGFTGVYGNITNLDLEACPTCFILSNQGRTYQPLSAAGLKINGATIVPEIAGYAFDLSDTATPAGFPNTPMFFCSNMTFHSSPTGASRGIWTRAGSSAVVTWQGGSAHNFTNEHLCRMDSATGVFHADHVATPTTKTRTSNGGGGTVSDTNQIVI